MRQLANWFRRKKLENHLGASCATISTGEIGDLERAGLPTAEARRQAMLELGASRKSKRNEF
jgi:hypothetical protein